MDDVISGVEVGTLQFSAFRAPISNTIPFKVANLKEVKRVIAGERYKEKTLALRGIRDKDQRNEFKIKNFDYVTFSCIARRRNSADIEKHSNLFCVDLDHIGESGKVAEMKGKIIENFPPALMFTSPSGDGLKVVHQIDITQGEHLDYFNALKLFYLREYSIKIDEACKDIVRACFLCYDPDVYFNDNPTILDRSFIDTFSHTIPIPELKPRDYTHQEVIKNLKIWLDKGESFIEGNRNNYLSKLAGACNRAGIPEAIALSELLRYSEGGFTENEIESTVKSIYRRSDLFGIAPFDVNKPYDFKVNIEAVKSQPDPIQLLPIEPMPEFLQDFIKEFCRVYNLPRDFIAGSVILSTALAIGNKLELVGKYRNVPILWMNFIGNVSSGKTEPLSLCLSLFTQRDSEKIKAYKRDINQYEAEMLKPKKERDNNLQKPECFQYILNDYTPEALAQVHSVNDRGLCVYRDELKGWFDDFGRYNKSGEQSNMLSSYYRQSITYNRKGSGVINIEKPCILVAGGMQIDILPALAYDSRAENGFLSRFCNIFPDHSEKQYFTNAVLSDEIMGHYFNYLNALISIPETIQLNLSSRAVEVYTKWFNENADKTNEEPSGYLKGVFGKLDVICLRIAIVLHGMDFACTYTENDEISGAAMEGAVKITEYFRATALKVHHNIFSEAKGEDVDNKKIILYCRSKGASQNQIADALKVSQQYVQKICNR